MIRKWRPLLLIVGTIAAGMACTMRKTKEWSEPVGRESEVPQRLSQQNADAAIYQNSSAEVKRLYEQCYELARLRLDANLARPHTLPAAVIVDIDETVLDNSPFQITNIARGRTYSQTEWTAWTRMARAQALPGAVAFLKYVETHGCEVFYISNRSNEEKAATMQNLQAQGFPMANDAHVLCMEGTSDKTERRAQVARDHYIALLAGDQLRDFDERFKDRSQDHGRGTVDAMHDTLSNYFILLPNPMYGTWLDGVSGRTDSLKLGAKARFFNEQAY